VEKIRIGHLHILVTPSQKFSADWIEDCLKWRGHVLTGKKAHWCFDWDDLPMDETCLEYKERTCHCFEEDENES
jgi:hypothetical protein